ncbi:hypothetical protein [Paracoccus sp. 22332]|uniref:hypothetical protein n=1 Tax=Paracoccus sp. 22332 TaxID=3453913 RepID=UPI003F84AB2B
MKDDLHQQDMEDARDDYSAAGSQVVISNRNLLPTGTYELTGPGITVVNNGATLPAGVSVTGGKLVLEV